MKKSYGYVSRNRVTNDAAQGQASSSRYSINASAGGPSAAASVMPFNSQSAQSAGDIDRQLLRFFKEQE